MCRRAGGPLKGVQALKASLEALQSLRRLPFRHESIASSTGAAAHLAAWQTVAEAVQVLLRECLIACPGQHACARACAYSLQPHVAACTVDCSIDDLAAGSAERDGNVAGWRGPGWQQDSVQGYGEGLLPAGVASQTKGLCVCQCLSLCAA